MHTYKNLCTRCGSERIIVKIWEEMVGQSVVVTKEMACPNKDCQDKVDKENKRQKDKATALRFKSEQRAIDRKTARNVV